MTGPLLLLLAPQDRGHAHPDPTIGRLLELAMRRHDVEARSEMSRQLARSATATVDGVTVTVLGPGRIQVTRQ